jgi:ArsR family transcriptional regulator
LARQRAAQHNLTNCEFRLGELEHLPLSDGEVELVIIGLVLQHVVDPQAVLLEAARALDHGGKLTVVEPARHEITEAREDLGEFWMGFEEHEIRSWLSAAGFSVDVIDNLPSRANKLGLVAVTAQKL